MCDMRFASDDVFYLEVCFLNHVCRNKEELFSVDVGETFRCDFDPELFKTLRTRLDTPFTSHAHGSPNRRDKMQHHTPPKPAGVPKRMTSARTPCSRGRAAIDVTVSTTHGEAERVSLERWLEGLNSSSAEWRAYIQSVYGQDVGHVDLARLHWFWWWAPGAASLERIEHVPWRPPPTLVPWSPGGKMERALAAAGFFIFKPSSSAPRGFRHNTWIEVMRVLQPSGTQHKFGVERASLWQMWFWHAPGSGIWWHTGRATLVAQNRSMLVSLLAGRLGDAWSPSMFLACTLHSRGNVPVPMLRGLQPLCDVVRLARIETVQLLDELGGRFELIDCRIPLDLTSTDDKLWDPVCPSSEGRSSGLRAGWPPRLRRCQCSNRLKFLNCGECIVPAIPQFKGTAFPPIRNGSLRCELQLAPGEGVARVQHPQSPDRPLMSGNSTCRAAFPSRLENQHCVGLRHMPSVADAEACNLLCCQQEDCAIWRFCPNDSGLLPWNHCSRQGGVSSSAVGCFIAGSEDGFSCDPAPQLVENRTVGHLQAARIDMPSILLRRGW
eukprot:6976906-Prymnesium_polylepis.1